MVQYLRLPVLLLLMAGCTRVQTPEVSSLRSAKLVFDEAVLDSLDLYAAELVRAHYRRNQFVLTWLDTGGLRPAGDSLMAFIRHSAKWGLNPRHYRVNTSQRNDITDIHLTDTWFAMAVHLKHGRVDGKLQMTNVSRLADSTFLNKLADVAATGRVVASLAEFEPTHTPYHKLKAALQKECATGEGGRDETFWRRIETIHINMERWRWEKQALPGRYLAVNTPAFRLRILEDDSVVLTSNVIVGRKETPTPELRSVIRTFIIYPYWHVPRSILRELLPNIRADSTYLDRRNYQVLGANGRIVDHRTIDWQSVTAETFPYILRQREGDENTMGVLKFVFANNYNVYLHDTNARGLFSRSHRALSHGCVRVHRAVDLARYLAKDDDIYVGPEDLDQYLEVKAKMTVKVVKPLPVLLQYFTAETDAGKLLIYDDIYDKDIDVSNALYHLELHREGG